jgi:hypothetical protein
VTGESLPVLVDRLRAELDRLEAIAHAAAQHAGTANWDANPYGNVLAADSAGDRWMAVGPYAGDLRDTGVHIATHDPAYVLRTIQAHRKVLERYETALVCRDAAVDTPLAGATRIALRLEREHLELVASIYFPESDG